MSTASALFAVSVLLLVCFRLLGFFSSIRRRLLLRLLSPSSTQAPLALRCPNLCPDPRLEKHKLHYLTASWRSATLIFFVNFSSWHLLCSPSFKCQFDYVATHESLVAAKLVFFSLSLVKSGFENSLLEPNCKQGFPCTCAIFRSLALNTFTFLLSEWYLSRYVIHLIRSPRVNFPSPLLITDSEILSLSQPY